MLMAANSSASRSRCAWSRSAQSGPTVVQLSRVLHDLDQAAMQLLDHLARCRGLRQRHGEAGKRERGRGGQALDEAAQDVLFSAHRLSPLPTTGT
jgi:hypothetical protein